MWKRRILRVPWELPPEFGDQAVRACLDALRSVNPVRFRWLLLQTVIARGERVSFAKRFVVLHKNVSSQ